MENEIKIWRRKWRCTVHTRKGDENNGGLIQSHLIQSTQRMKINTRKINNIRMILSMNHRCRNLAGKKSFSLKRYECERIYNSNGFFFRFEKFFSFQRLVSLTAVSSWMTKKDRRSKGNWLHFFLCLFCWQKI